MKRLAVIVALAFAVSAQAATIDQLRQRLAEFRGTTAVAGKLEIEEEETNKRRSLTRRGSVEFECDPAGLRVAVPARDLTRQEGPDGQDGTARIDLRGLWARLNAAPALLDELKKAIVVAEQPSSWKGAPATRLELNIKTEPPEDVPRMLKLKADVKRIFWVGPDGTPLRAETHTKFSARFLVISASGKQSGTEEYEVIGDRLVIIREIDDGSSAGMGESGQKRTSTTVVVRR